jgi:hypothetical protein
VVVCANAKKSGDSGFPCGSILSAPLASRAPASFCTYEQEFHLIDQAATGDRNAHASVWEKNQASLDDRHQTPDQKIDVGRLG